MQIVLLAAGAGTRFSSYSPIPKPFILVHGIPMWQNAMNNWLGYGSPTLVLQRDHAQYYHAPDYDINVVWIDELTDGAAETAYIACKDLNENEPVCFIDSDGFIEFSNWNNTGGGTFVVDKNSDQHSYCRLDDRGNILEIREKEVISNIANTGHYWWHSVKLYREIFEYAVENNLKTKNEYYMAPLYNIAIQQGWRFTTHPVKRWVCWGTPEDLEKYLSLQ